MRRYERLGIEPLARCFWCDAVCGFDMVVDHVVPQKRGGPDEAWNAVPSCPRCNTAKSDMWPSAFAAHRLYDRINAEWRQPVDYAHASHWLLTRKDRAIQVEEEFRRWAVETGNAHALRHLARYDQEAA